MKHTRWIVPAAILVMAACNDASQDPTTLVTQRQASVSCDGDCVSTISFRTLIAPVPSPSDTSPPAPAPTRVIRLGSVDYIGVLANINGLNVDQIGKTAFWTSQMASDTSPPAPAPPQPGTSIAGKMGRAAFLSLLNAASASGGVGPAPSDTSPPGPGPVGAIWRNSSGVPTQVLLLMSVANMQKFGATRAGDTFLNMRMEPKTGKTKSLGNTYSSLSVNVISGKVLTGGQ